MIALFSFHANSQEIPTIKHLDKSTISQVTLDYDNDGDLDYIFSGVIANRHQGRVYIIENKAAKFSKPEYIYSFPTVLIKQTLNVIQSDNITTINIIGTSPEGVKSKYESSFLIAFG